jgi:hypothetical protein
VVRVPLLVSVSVELSVGDPEAEFDNVAVWDDVRVGVFVPDGKYEMYQTYSKTSEKTKKTICKVLFCYMSAVVTRKSPIRNHSQVPLLTL